MSQSTNVGFREIVVESKVIRSLRGFMNMCAHVRKRGSEGKRKESAAEKKFFFPCVAARGKAKRERRKREVARRKRRGEKVWPNQIISSLFFLSSFRGRDRLFPCGAEKNRNFGDLSRLLSRGSDLGLSLASLEWKEGCPGKK